MTTTSARVSQVKQARKRYILRKLGAFRFRQAAAATAFPEYIGHKLVEVVALVLGGGDDALLRCGWNGAVGHGAFNGLRSLSLAVPRGPGGRDMRPSVSVRVVMKWTPSVTDSFDNLKW